MTTTTASAGAYNSFPKLLDRNAREFADKPAAREKEFGIWQSWTWAEAREETRAFALGLMALGLNPGDRLAVIGRNRPKLYWSMVAAQMVGAARITAVVSISWPRAMM